MCNTRWPLYVSIGLALVVAARMTVVAATHGSENSRTIISQNEYVFKVEEHIFTGAVVTNDPKGKTITIEGHNPLRRETVERFVSRDQAGRGKQGDKPPAVKDSTQVFQVDSLCHVSLTNKPSAQLSDIQTGDVVDVDYRKMAGGVMIASDIRTADKHPYDLPPAKARKKK